MVVLQTDLHFGVVNSSCALGVYPFWSGGFIILCPFWSTRRIGYVCRIPDQYYISLL